MRSLIVLALLVAACSTPEPEPTTAPAAATPEAAAAAWLSAVTIANTEELGRTVEPTGLAIVIGVENALRSDELVALLDGGLAPDAADRYWSSFRDDFEAIRGFAVADLVVVTGSEMSPRDGFALVEVRGESSGGQVVLRRSEAAGWQVDMVATVGPALVGRLGDYLDSALAGENADVIAEAYRSAVLPALDVAAELDPTNSDLVFGVEYIRQLATA